MNPSGLINAKFFFVSQLSKQMFVKWILWEQNTESYIPEIQIQTVK